MTNYLGTTRLEEAFSTVTHSKGEDVLREKMCALEKQVCDLKMWNFYMIIIALAVLLIISLLFNIVQFGQRK